MKISQTSGTTAAGRKRSVAGGKDKAAGADFAKHIDEPSSGSALAPTAPLAALGGVLSVQEVPDATAERRRAAKHGATILDELDQLQLNMIGGWVSESDLHRLAKLLDARRPDVDDAQLDGVLDEIELRAAVELAKLQRDPG